MANRREIAVRIRHGRSVPNYPLSEVPIKVAVVADGFLWLGASRAQGIAWIAGKKTLRDLRDALTKMLDGELPMAPEPSSTGESK